VADLRKVVSLSEQEAEEMGRQNKILTAGWRWPCWFRRSPWPSGMWRNA